MICSIIAVVLASLNALTFVLFATECIDIGTGWGAVGVILIAAMVMAGLALIGLILAIIDAHNPERRNVWTWIGLFGNGIPLLIISLMFLLGN